MRASRIRRWHLYSMMKPEPPWTETQSKAFWFAYSELMPLHRGVKASARRLYFFISARSSPVSGRSRWMSSRHLYTSTWAAVW